MNAKAGKGNSLPVRTKKISLEATRDGEPEFLAAIFRLVHGGGHIVATDNKGNSITHETAGVR